MSRLSRVIFPALVSMLGGFVLALAFPGTALWPLTPVAVGLLIVAQRGLGFLSGFLVGFAGGMTFWLSLIDWLTLYLGPLPWVALCTLMALYMGLAGALISLAWRWVPIAWPSRWGRWLLTPMVIGGLWVSRETLAASWPYGGFSWGRVSMSLAESPLFTGGFSWWGATGVSFLTVSASAVIVTVLCERYTEDSFSTRDLSPEGLALPRPRASTLTGMIAGGVAVAIAWPAWPTFDAGEWRVLAVQGGADASLFSQLPPEEIFKAHTKVTLEYLGQPFDAVVWPENAAAVDPTRSETAAFVLDSLSRDFNAPFVVGVITVRDNKFYNSSLQWQYPEGVVDYYDKAHPVPFAEYMPDRAFWRPFAPDLVDLVSRDYSPGVEPNVFDLGSAMAGIAICFDIANDHMVQEMIRDGAEVILAQTNNADFGRTDESLQQLSIARMRALETGRAVVNISTVGSSAVINHDGQTIASLPTWTAGALAETVTLRSGHTLAMAWGSSSLKWVFAGGSLAILALAGLLAVRERRA